MKDATSSYRWWLGLQITLGLVGGGVWLVGAILEVDFVAGLGCGILVGGLVLRLGRRSTGPPA